MNSLNALCDNKHGSHLQEKKTNLDPNFSSLWRIHLDVNDVQRLLGLPGHGSLAGDDLALSLFELVQEGLGNH